MGRSTRRLLLSALALTALAVGIWYAARPEPVRVPVAKVTLGVVEETVANTRTGTVKASCRAKIAPDISGG